MFSDSLSVLSLTSAKWNFSLNSYDFLLTCFLFSLLFCFLCFFSSLSSSVISSSSPTCASIYSGGFSGSTNLTYFLTQETYSWDPAFICVAMMSSGTPLFSELGLFVFKNLTKCGTLLSAVTKWSLTILSWLVSFLYFKNNLSYLFAFISASAIKWSLKSLWTNSSA